MELITYNNKNSKTTTTRLAVTISRRGSIDINKQAGEILGLASCEGVIFHQDKEKKKDWYIEVIKDDNEKEALKIKLRADGRSYGLYAKLITKEFIEACNWNDTFSSQRYMISKEVTTHKGRDLHPILTAKSINELNSKTP